MLRTALAHATPGRRLSTSSGSLLVTGRGLTITGVGAFPFRWLRDACPCAACVHPSTRQKLHASSEIPRDVRPNEVKLDDGALHVLWPGHKAPSVYERKYLEAYATPDGTRAMHGDQHLTRQGWTAADIEHDAALFVDYASLLQVGGARLGAYEQLARKGLLIVTGVPHEQTDDGEVRRVAGVFGEIRETFYGQTWDVVARRASTNIAYTSLFLGLHMDLLYFAHPPRLQLLHCLRNRVVGGTSLFVDALAAADTLRATEPAAFDVLTKVPVPFHYQNAGHHLHHAHPTLVLDPRTGAVDHVNYAPPFQAPLPADTPDALYDALAAFAHTLAEPGRTFRYLLREGDVAVFDNRRVLHAREAFVDPAEDADAAADGEPNRWLMGCYIEADALLDRARVLRKKLDLV